MQAMSELREMEVLVQQRRFPLLLKRSVPFPGTQQRQSGICSALFISQFLGSLLRPSKSALCFFKCSC